MGGLRKREMAVCGVCKRKVWRQHLKRHLKQHTEERAYVCNLCGIGFTHKCALKRHVLTLTCKPLQPQRDLVTESILPQEVSVLEESIPNAVLQEGNVVEHETSGDICMSVSSQKSSEAVLVTMEPPKEREKTDVECKVCRGRYPAEVFDQHMKQHAMENEKFRCELCGMNFFQKNDLVSHRSENNCSQVPFIASYEGKSPSIFARSCEIKTVECEICHKNINKNMVKRHKRMHTEERPFKCESCGCGFNFRGNMTKHQLLMGCKLSSPIRVRRSKPVVEIVSQEISKANEVIAKVNVKKQRLATTTCSVCHRLVHGHFMKRHMKQHAEERKYKCALCSLGFNHKQALNHHIAKNTCIISDHAESVTGKCTDSESVRKVSLPYPGDKTDEEKYESHAEVIKKKVQCQNCGTSFSNRSNLYRHLKNKKCGLSSIEEIHEKKVLDHVGKSENKILDAKMSSSNVYQYKESVDSKVIADVIDATKETCLICRKVFSSKRKLEEHMEEHLFRRMFRCVLCPKKYFSLAKCRKHMRSGHADVSDSVCRLCNKEIDDFNELEDHLFYHRWDKIYKCMLCNKVILKPIILKSHLESHAGKNVESSSKSKTSGSTKGAILKNINPGSHCCTICKLLFSSSSNLASHMKTHVVLDSSCNDNDETLLNSIDDVTVFITDSNEEEDTERRLGHDLEGTANGNNQNSDPLRDCEGDLSVFGDHGTQITNDDCSSYARDGILPNNESSASVISTSVYPSKQNIDMEAVGQRSMNDTSSRMSSTEETFSKVSVGLSECSVSSDYALVGGEVSNIGGNKEDQIIDRSGEAFQNRVKEVTVYITESGAQETGFHDELVSESEVRGSENSDPLTRDNVVNDSSCSGFTCIICNEQFLTRGSLEVHMSTHVEGRFHICNVCGESFSQKNYLRKHMAEHGENQKFRCSVCWVDFLFDSDLANHMNTHVAKAKKYDCIDCGRKFIKKSGLVRHSAVHSKNRLFTCDLCQLTFISKDALHQHLKNHTENNEQEIEASVREGSQKVFDCDSESRERKASTFHNEGKLEAKEDDGVNMTCPVCGKVCKTRGSYTLHIKIHSTNRKYKCEICDRRYGSKLKLRKHRKKYNHKRVLELFQKSSAEGEFTSKGGEFDDCERTLTPLSETVHESATEDEVCEEAITDISSNIHKYLCNVCYKEFRSKSEFLAHKQMHVSGQKYPCHICESTFTRKAQLDEHYREHNSLNDSFIKGCKEPDLSSCMETSEVVSALSEQDNHAVCLETEDCDSYSMESEKFVCDICGKRCKKKSSLALHVKYHKPFKRCKCSLCDLNFPNLIELRKHEREHMNGDKIGKGASSSDEQSSILDEGKSDLNGEDEVMHDNTLEGDQYMQVDPDWSLTLKEKHSGMFGDNITESEPSSYSCQKIESHESSGIESEGCYCGICGKHCKTINNLILHQKMHLSHKGYDCSFCRLTFTSRLKYLKHQSVHEQSNNGGEAFNMEVKLSSIAGGEKEKCDVEDVKEGCGVNGFSFHSKNEKLAESDIASSKEYDCSLCSQTFSNKIKLQNHACEYKYCENDKEKVIREGKPPPLVDRNNVDETDKESEDRIKLADARDVSDLELLNGTVKESGGGKYVCPICGKKCSRNNSLVLHQKVHSYFKRYTCRMCSLVFQNKAKLYKHQKSHRLKNTMVTEVAGDDGGFNGGRFIESCGIEDVRDEYDTRLNGGRVTEGFRFEDVRDEYNTREKPKGMNDVSLDEEISRGSEKSLSESIEYSCNICLNKYLGKSAFINHLQMNHGDIHLGPDKFEAVEKNSFNEDEINGHDSSFASDSKFTGSLGGSERISGQVQTNVESVISQRKICYCIICKIEFKRPSGFARHMKIHGSIRYECNECSRVFSSKGRLKKHKKYHFQRKVLRRSLSGKSSVLIGEGKPEDTPTFNEHLGMGSGVDDEELKVRVPVGKSNVCSVCGMKFQKSCGLASHLRTHSMARPHSCSFCGRRFNSLVTMEMHISNIHGKKASAGNSSKPAVKIDRGKPSGRLDDDNDDDNRASLNASPKDSKSNEAKMDSAFYPCTFCELTFQRPCSLGSHLRVHLHTRSYSCSHCSRTFKSSVVLQKHERLCPRKKVVLRSNDEGEDDFRGQKETECTIEESETSTKSGALIDGQFKDLVNLDALACNICGLQFRKACGLQSHLRTHLNNRPYYCNLCDSTFTTAYTLKSHEKHRHKKELEELAVKDGAIKSDDYSGPVVDDFLGMSSDLHSPKERKNLPLNKRLHACEICGVKFRKMCDLAIHMKMHSDGISKKEIEPLKISMENQYKCHICTGKFSDDESFRLHLQSHEEEDILEKDTENPSLSSTEKKHSCKICGKKFRHSGNYKVHLWSHENKNATGKKDKNVPTKSAEGKSEQSTEQGKLFNYMGMKRTKSGHMKVECKLCGKLMAHRGNFVSHIRGHRDKGEVEALGKPEVDTVKDKINVIGHPIKCNICNKHFKSKWALDRHIHVHSKITINDGYKSLLNGHDLTNFDEEHDDVPSDNAVSHVVDNSGASDFNLASSSMDSVDFTPKSHWKGEMSSLSRDSNVSSENVLGSIQQNHKLKLESRTCKYCYKVFKYKSMCVYHTAKHSENDYKCAFCEGRFYYKKEFVIHVQSHENVLDSDNQGHEKSSKQEVPSDGKSQNKMENIPGVPNTVPKVQERDKNLSCRMCGKYLPTHKSFRKHQRIHLQQSKNRCVICVKKYKSRSSYRKHMRIHHPELEDKCSYCGVKCEGSCQYKLQETDKVDINESNGNEGLDSEAATPPISPQRGSRTKGDKGISHGVKVGEGCKAIKKKMQVPEVLPSSSHIDLQGNTNDIYDENLKDFVEANTVVDNAKAKPFICCICGKGFRYMKYIKLHMEVHLEKRFRCEICHKTARSAQRLKRHMTVHKLGKRFRCEDCGSAFTQMSSLKKHCHIFHRSKVENTDSPELEKRSESKSSEDDVKSDVVCAEKLPTQEFCDSDEGVSETLKVCDNSNLEGNEDDGTLENRPLFGKSNFVCHICGKVALSGSHLDSHMIRHSQEKPFKCPLCQKFFKRDYTVRKHIREIHAADPNQFHPKSLTSSGRDITVDLPYKCSICDKGFIYDTSLKAHTMFHMRETSLFSGECEEEVYECAVETNEDDGILSVESVRLEDTNKYLKEEKEYFVEDMAIDIKEELVDDIEEDYEDLLSEEFLLNDFDLMEQSAPEHLDFTAEIDGVSESIDFSNFSEGSIFGEESRNAGNYPAFSSDKEQDDLYIPENIEASCSSKC